MREPGFYWVRWFGARYVAEFQTYYEDAHPWTVPGLERLIPDNEIRVLSERLEPPEERE
jgi:hypothetical protein